MSSFLKLASQYIFEMNGIKGQQKGTADEKKKNMALDIVAAVYHNGVRKVLEANLGFKNYDTPKFS